MTMTSVPNHHAAPVHEPSAVVRAAAIVVLLTAAVALIAIAFALPAAKSGPHDIPIGAVGPSAANGQLADLLDHRAPGAFKVTVYPDTDALRAAIRDREVYGGISLAPNEPKVLIATGASPAVAQLMTQLGNGIAQQAGMPLHTEDLAAPPAGDPRGTGLAAAALPITLAGILSAVALTLLVPGAMWIIVTATAAFSGLAGMTIAALLRYPLGSIDENFWGVAGGLALGALATGSVVLGLGSLFGRAGLVLGALLALLVGNPLSGLTSAPEMLPGGWGEFGQFLAQGANATLLRSTAFFGGAGSSTAVAVLIGWAVVGALIIVIAAQRRAMQSISRAGEADRVVTAPTMVPPRPVQTAGEPSTRGFLRDRVQAVPPPKADDHVLTASRTRQ